MTSTLAAAVVLVPPDPARTTPALPATDLPTTDLPGTDLPGTDLAVVDPAPTDRRPIASAVQAPRVRRLGAGPLSPLPGSPPPVQPPPPEPVEPDDRRAITAAVRTALEVLDGRRPVGQLGAMFDQTALRYWRAEVGRHPAATPARLLRARLCRPIPACVEVAAVCAIGGRVRAVAARFERRGPGWRCTTVRLI